MKTTVRACVVLGCAMLVVSAVQFGVVNAATPAGGSLDTAHRTVSWSGGPLSGSTPAFRRITCNQSVNCDDFALNVNLPAASFAPGVPVLKIEATTSAPNAIEILLYEPGKAPSQTENTFTQYGDVAKVRAPRSGSWLVRINCSPCADAMYTAKASVETSIPHDDAPNFTHLAMPGTKAGTFEGAAEPGIEIAKHGEIWVNGVGSGADFWGSYDGGKTFTLHQPDISPTVGDTWLSVGPDGTVYADNLSHAGGTNLVYASKDQGKTWSSLPAIANTDSDRQWPSADPDHAGVVYFTYHDLGDGAIWVWKSTDYGQTWAPIASITEQEFAKRGEVDSFAGNTSGPLVFAPDGSMYMTVTFNDFVEAQTASPTREDFDVSRIFVLRSTDGGSTWDFSLPVDRFKKGYTHHGHAHLTVDRSSNLYLVWSERPVNDVTTDVLLETSKDKGNTWSAAKKISTNNASNIFPSAAAKGDPGKLDVAWLESASKDFNDHKSKWKVVMAQSFDALAATPTWTRMQVSPDVIHESDVCQAGTLCAVTGGNRTLLDYIWMDVDAKGMAHIVYADDTSGLRTVYARQITGAGTVGTAVLGSHKTRGAPRQAGGALPSTGVESGAFGLALLAIAGVFGRRLRRVHNS